MVYNVTTYMKDKEIESNNLTIKNKSVYEILNKYLRAKNNKIEENTKKVMNL